MAPTKSTRKKVVKTERSWLYRHFGSVVFSTLIFSTVAYAIAWPTVPGEAGYPVEWSFWKIFEKILVDTGAANDGTVKKAQSVWIIGGINAVNADRNGNIWVWGMTASGDYTLSVSGQALFTDTVLGTPPTSSWHLATKWYVDGVVSAWGGGGGYNQCYRIKNATKAYPTCAAWFTRVFAAYLESGGWWASKEWAIHFENNAWGFWFSQFGHIYFYYDDTSFVPNVMLYDDQDVPLSSWTTNCNLNVGTAPTLSSVFSQSKSTYQTYSAVGPASFTCNWSSPTEFGYAVCCK